MRRTMLLVFLVGCPAAESHVTWETGVASWYSRKECMTRTNPDALMANGRPLDDAALTCASWDYPFGTVLRVETACGARGVDVTVTDRGPAKRLYAQGRKIDLTRAAFSRLAHLDAGLVGIRYRRIER